MGRNFGKCSGPGSSLIDHERYTGVAGHFYAKPPAHVAIVDGQCDGAVDVVSGPNAIGINADYSYSASNDCSWFLHCDEGRVELEFFAMNTESLYDYVTVRKEPPA